MLLVVSANVVVVNVADDDEGDDCDDCSEEEEQDPRQPAQRLAPAGRTARS